MTNAHALTKRDELVESGFTIVPCVMDSDLLDRLKAWSNGIFDRVQVSNKVRYQGSDIFVKTERSWTEATPTMDNRFPDPFAADILDQPRQVERAARSGWRISHRTRLLSSFRSPGLGRLSTGIRTT